MRPLHKFARDLTDGMGWPGHFQAGYFGGRLKLWAFFVCQGQRVKEGLHRGLVEANSAAEVNAARSTAEKLTALFTSKPDQ